MQGPSYYDAGYALSLVIHRVQSENIFYKPWLVYEMVRYGWPSVSGLAFIPRSSLPPPLPPPFLWQTTWYIKSTTVYVPSELGLSLASECASPLRTKGWGAHLPADEGSGSPDSDDLRKSLEICILCVIGSGILLVYLATWVEDGQAIPKSVYLWALIL